jgi:subtilisin
MKETTRDPGQVDFNPEKKAYIVKFKAKDKRAEKKLDKTEIVQNAVGPSLTFNDIKTLPDNFLPPSSPEGLVASDINDPELRTVFLRLSDKELKTLKNDTGNVEKVEEDGIFWITDIDVSAMSGLESPAIAGSPPSAQADTIPWGISNVGAPQCWDATKGKEIYVAVLDTGIWPHDDLKGNLIGGISFVPNENWVDVQGHGTHVAGTIAAALNGFGVVGVAPSAYVFAMKVLANNGQGNWSWLMQALYRLRQTYGCLFDVANMSLGGSAAPAALEDYVNFASQNTLLVAAAGNHAPSAPQKPVGFPARYDRCLAVSAIDSTNTIASFSARGPEVDICAPGVGVVSTVPNNNYASFSGTSMASPHVAGVAALVRGTHRFSDMDHIRELLEQSAINLGPPGKDPEYGFGRVNCSAVYRRTCG